MHIELCSSISHDVLAQEREISAQHLYSLQEISTRALRNSLENDGASFNASGKRRSISLRSADNSPVKIISGAELIAHLSILVEHNLFWSVLYKAVSGPDISPKIA